MSTRPTVSRLLREKIAGTSSQSFAAAARRRRWDLFLRRFPDLANCRVIDLGGTPAFWIGAPVQPSEVTVVNLPSVSSYAGAPPWIKVVTGDACDSDALLAGGARYDIVFSNSTIEHVGGHAQCVAFARSVRALGPRHWVQTPYRYFPIEPHFVFPGLQFVPLAVRWRIIAAWPLSYTKSIGGTLQDPTGTAMWVELLGRTQMEYYFPESELLSERFFGLTKSLIAVSS